mgnify:CR=1 FL=1
MTGYKISNLSKLRFGKNICKNFNIEDLMNSFMIVDRAQRDLMQNRNIDLIVENAVLSLRGFAGPSK